MTERQFFRVILPYENSSRVLPAPPVRVLEVADMKYSSTPMVCSGGPHDQMNVGKAGKVSDVVQAHV